MESIKIPFRGITRNTDDGICTDGESMELINARIKNNSVEPIGTPVLLKSFSDNFSQIYFHPLAKKYICIREGDGTLIAFDEKFESEEIISTDISGVDKIEFIGNVVCVITNESIFYVIHKKGVYYYMGSKPEFRFSAYPTEEKEISTSDSDVVNWIPKYPIFGSSNLTDIDFRDIPYFVDSITSQRNKILEPLKNENRRINPVIVRAAIRTNTGDYIMHSPPILICPSNYVLFSTYGLPYRLETLYNSLKLRKMFGNVDGGGNKRYLEMRQILNSYRIKYEIEFTGSSIWKDVISSIDIFVSNEINLMDIEYMEKNGLNLTAALVGDYLSIPAKSIRKIEEDVIDQTLYQVKNVNSDEKDYLPLPNIAGDIVLSEDAFTHNDLSAYSSYVYNNRLHLGYIKSKLFHGFMDEFSLYGISKFNGHDVNASSIAMLFNMFVFIASDSGEKVVNYRGTAINPLNSLFMYPDSRATSAIIYAAFPDGDGNIMYSKKTLSLIKSKSRNIAYHYGTDEDGFSPIDMSKATSIMKEEYDAPPYTIDDIELSNNKLKVSELNNPFFFPAKTTYIPSNSEIVALSSNTTALSQGQFGQHPLLVFCKDGIYAMSVGTGDIVYSSSTPLSRDVCNNPDSVTSIDNAVVFSTVQGLKMVQGASVIGLSDALGGFLPSCIISSPIISKILDIGNLRNSLSSVIFQDYIAEAKIGYNYQSGEIIVSNRKYGYSYLYNFESGTWSKLSLKIDRFANFYPDTCALVNDGEKTTLLYDLNNAHISVSTIALISRPIKMGTNSHKRILQSALRGIVKRSLSDLYLRGESITYRGEGLELFTDVGFYILGSNDAEHYSLISGKESIIDLRDLITKMNKSKPYKYFMIALVGGVRTDVSINYLEMIVDESFNNRLR